MSSYSFNHCGRRVVVDRAGQVLRAEFSPSGGWQERPPHDEATVDTSGGIEVFSYEAAQTWTAPIHPNVAAAGVGASFTPLMALAIKAKDFDDQLYACIEGVAHKGAGDYKGLLSCLDVLRVGLPDGSASRGLFDAAHHLMGNHLPRRGRAKLAAGKWLLPFKKDAKASKPIGFYAENEWLSQVFRHDRLLQAELDPGVAGEIRTALETSGMRPHYEKHLALCARLTGPFAWPTVLDAEALEPRFLPPSDSAEGRIVKELFEGRSIPADFKLGRELVERIRDGRLQTQPRDVDGWYAHQFHAIAALLHPESEGLEVGPLYRADLEETFEALFAMNRETHAKQLECAVAGGSPLVVAPDISVEPLPEYYGRVADAYAFLGAELGAILGEEVLSCVCLPSKVSVADGLTNMELLFRGAELTSRDELGQEAPRGPLQSAARAHFRSWQSTSADDPALNEDLRVAVPVFYDLERETLRICVTLGVQTRQLVFEFLKTPRVRVNVDEPGRFGDEPFFENAKHLVLSPVTMECDVREAPTRKALRAICDRHESREAIRAALEA